MDGSYFRVDRHLMRITISPSAGPAVNLHLPSARSNIRTAGNGPFSLFGFLYGDFALHCEASRQRSREQGRHVLTMKTGASKSGGRTGITLVNAVGPPVDTPISTSASGALHCTGEDDAQSRGCEDRMLSGHEP